MAIVKQGNTTLNSGAKGDMPSFIINGETVEDGSNITVQGADGIATPITTLEGLQGITLPNKIISIQADIDLATTTTAVTCSCCERIDSISPNSIR